MSVLPAPVVAGQCFSRPLFRGSGAAEIARRGKISGREFFCLTLQTGEL